MFVCTMIGNGTTVNSLCALEGKSVLNNRLPVHVQSTVRFRIRPETWKKYVHIQVEGGKGGHQVRRRRGVRRFKFMHCQCEVNIDQGTWRFRCCVT